MWVLLDFLNIFQPTKQLIQALAELYEPSVKGTCGKYKSTYPCFFRGNNLNAYTPGSEKKMLVTGFLFGQRQPIFMDHELGHFSNKSTIGHGARLQ